MPSAEEVVIKAAYKALAQRYHPDRFKGDKEFAKGKMEALNEAYRVLSDPVLRKAYDRELMELPMGKDRMFDEWIHAFVDNLRYGD